MYMYVSLYFPLLFLVFLLLGVYQSHYGICANRAWSGIPRQWDTGEVLSNYRTGAK